MSPGSAGLAVSFIALLSSSASAWCGEGVGTGSVIKDVSVSQTLEGQGSAWCGSWGVGSPARLCLWAGFRGHPFLWWNEGTRGRRPGSWGFSASVPGTPGPGPLQLGWVSLSVLTPSEPRTQETSWGGAARPICSRPRPCLPRGVVALSDTLWGAVWPSSLSG